MTINELLGEPDSFGIIVASQIDTILDMAVWPHDVGAVIAHGRSPYVAEDPFSSPIKATYRPVMENIMLPSSGPRQRDILLHLRNFSVWLK
jgi:hypothetical protein